MASKRKLISAVIAVALAAAILMGGTFAWQSISQMALNEVYGHVNPGGRLHDDFTILQNDKKEPILTEEGTKQYDKNVYVENFTTLADDGVQIFARIRLDEYMETGLGAGEDDPEKNQATSLVYGATLGDTTSWTPHIPGNEEDPFHDYWDWTMAGQGADGTLGTAEADGVWYMPTFNKNKDSLQADINGTFDAGFEDYEDYGLTKDHAVTAEAVYDNDGDTEDEASPVEGDDIKKVSETHYAKEIGDSTVITMADWLKLDEDKKVGPYWVWDTDGWAYWASPIDPDSVTGLFLDGIARTTKIINEDWYYGINVVAQFITADDLGRDDGTGFYDAAEGAAPSTNALKLLAAIGVDVDTTVTTAEALTSAFELGGNVTVSGEINGTTEVKPWEGYDQYTSEYVMANGGTLNGGTVTVDGDKVFGLVVEAGATSNSTSALNNVDLAGNSEAVLYVGENGGHVTLNGVNVTADGGAGIYAEFAQGGVTLNNCTVNQNGISAGHDAWFQTAVAAAQGAKITINGGTYSSATGWAVYVFPTGGKVTINDGTFTGELKADNTDEIVIKGGTFSADPTQYVADGYKAEFDTAISMWVVTTA